LSTTSVDRCRESRSPLEPIDDPARNTAEEYRQRLAELDFHAVLSELCPNPVLGFLCGFLQNLLKNLTICRRIYELPNPERARGEQHDRRPRLPQGNARHRPLVVPKPRVDLTRFHGVFAPISKYRARVTPGKRARGGQQARPADPQAPTPAERRAAMTWAQRLKRVFGIDIQTCAACGGAVRIIACIEDPDVIDRILTHLNAQAPEAEAPRRPPCRAPP